MYRIGRTNIDVIKNSKTCNNTYKSKSTVNCLKNQLCCSVFCHNFSFYLETNLTAVPYAMTSAAPCTIAEDA